MIQLVVSVLLFFVMFFGISFILNMLLRRTWFMSVLYPFIIVIVINDIKMFDYVKHPISSFSTAFGSLAHLQYEDVIILLSGLAGTIVSGIVIRILRKSGYQMF